MTVNNFYAACFKNATLARNEAGTEQAFETRQLLRLRRALKILVSVVRFRPWPPISFTFSVAMQKVFFIRAEWDDDAKVWVATSDDVPGLVTEANTIELLAQKLESLVPELLEENDLLISGEVAYELLARRFSVTQMKAPL